MDNLTKMILSGLGGTAFGLLLSIGVDSIVGPSIESVKLFSGNDHPAAMRMYRPAGIDVVYVETSEGTYVPSEEYLSTIENEADREIERIEIRRAAGFYDSSEEIR